MTEESVTSESCVGSSMSNSIEHLYHFACVKDTKEAITVAFHVFMLESGFIPKDVLPDDRFQSMPKDWNVKGIFKIKYGHFCCSSYTCYMTCVPLYDNISVHGIICDVDCPESVDIKVKIKNYVKKEKVSNVLEAFSNFEELSRYFKDNFCLPLLNLLHETIGKSRLYGLRGLLDELKIFILEFLPVESVLSMAVVNKNFNNLTNSPSLWKHLFQRDFAKGGVMDIDTSSDVNWKQLYLKEYRKKKRREERTLRVPRLRMPQFFSIGPDYDSDLSIHFDPPPPELFPPLQSLFPHMLPRHLLRRL